MLEAREVRRRKVESALEALTRLVRVALGGPDESQQVLGVGVIGLLSQDLGDLRGGCGVSAAIRERPRNLQSSLQPV